jgi:hypothetical protein
MTLIGRVRCPECECEVEADEVALEIDRAGTLSASFTLPEHGDDCDAETIEWWLKDGEQRISVIGRRR